MKGTAALAANIAIAWEDAPIEVVCLERKELKEETYLAVNPTGKVPALVFDDGDVLTETVAILTYIGAAHSGAAHDAYTRDKKLGRKEAEALAFLNSEIHATFKVHFHPNLFATTPKTEKAARHKTYWRLDKYFEQLDAKIAEHKGPWLLSQKSYADAYLYIIGRWVETTPMELEDYPNLLAHQQMMEKDEAVLLALGRQNMTPRLYFVETEVEDEMRDEEE
jgi:glutathione S-transferase